MRHKKSRHTLNRFSSWHDATLKSLARSILIYQSIRTTKARAKAARPLVEKLISLGKANTLAAKRAAYRILGDHKLVSLLFRDIAVRFLKRQGGFCRILSLGVRRGDNAEMVIFELTEIKKKEYKKVKKEKETRPVDKHQPAQEGRVQEEHKPKTETVVRENKPPIKNKPPNKFLGGIRNIFKKKSDSL